MAFTLALEINTRPLEGETGQTENFHAAFTDHFPMAHDPMKPVVTFACPGGLDYL